MTVSIPIADARLAPSVSIASKSTVVSLPLLDEVCRRHRDADLESFAFSGVLVLDGTVQIVLCQRQLGFGIVEGFTGARSVELDVSPASDMAIAPHVAAASEPLEDVLSAPDLGERAGKEFTARFFGEGPQISTLRVRRLSVSCAMRFSSPAS